MLKQKSEKSLFELSLDCPLCGASVFYRVGWDEIINDIFCPYCEDNFVVDDFCWIETEI